MPGKAILALAVSVLWCASTVMGLITGPSAASWTVAVMVVAVVYLFTAETLDRKPMPRPVWGWPRTKMERQIAKLMAGLPDLREVDMAERLAATENHPTMKAYRRVMREPQPVTAVGIFQAVAKTFDQIGRGARAPIKGLLSTAIGESSGYSNHYHGDHHRPTTHQGDCAGCNTWTVLYGNGLCAKCNGLPPDDWPWLKNVLDADSIQLTPTGAYIRDRVGWSNLYIRKRKPDGKLISVHVLVHEDSLKLRAFREQSLLPDLWNELIDRGCEPPPCWKAFTRCGYGDGSACLSCGVGRNVQVARLEPGEAVIRAGDTESPFPPFRTENEAYPPLPTSDLHG